MHRALALATLVLAGALLLVAAPSAAPVPSFLITGDTNIAGFPRDGKVKRAVALFGQPQQREPIAYDVCRLVWPVWGIEMIAYYGNTPDQACGPDAKHRSTTLTDRRWRTSTGLKIGDRLARLRQLYPKASRDAPNVWWLKTRFFAGFPFPGLEAKIRNGRVVSFTVHGPRSAF